MPKIIASADVDKIIALAKLNVTPEEQAVIRKELSSIVDYIDRLGEVETDDSLYSFEPTGISGLRADQADFFRDRELLLDLERFRDGLMVTKGVFAKKKNHDPK